MFQLLSGAPAHRRLPEPSKRFPKLRRLHNGSPAVALPTSFSPQQSKNSWRAHVQRGRECAMASVVASKRIPLMRAVEKLLAASPAPGAPSALRPVVIAGGARGYNSGAALRRYERDESDDDGSNRRGARVDAAVPSFFSDVFRDPFSAPQSLGRLLSLVDDMAAPGRAAPLRRGWNAKEDDEALRLRVDMPGLGKEHVKVWAEQNSLVIKGEGEKDSEEEGAAPPRYSGRVELAGDVYRMDKIKAEMKNGVLKVVVPKVKEEERRDVFQVNVD